MEWRIILLYLFGLLVNLSATQNIPSDASCPDKPFNCDTFCPYGYTWGFNGQCTCTCHTDPCLGKICDPNSVCIVQTSGNRFWASCQGAIDDCLPGVEVSQCFVSPCILSPCYRNDSLLCVANYCGGCFAHFFTRPGNKEVTRECRALSYARGAVSKPGTCPQLSEGFCFKECSSDADCLAERKCCSNGCGQVCVSPELEKTGVCPPQNLVLNKNCQTQCARDSQCSSDQKCCSNGCAQVCSAAAAPSKDCGNLRDAVHTLPSRSLGDGYSPQCEPDGSFKQVQCDQRFCYCVKPTGELIFGTKIPVTASRTPNCFSPQSCFITQCSNFCVHGYKTDALGCPTGSCECRDLCEGINCQNNYQTCQLVEPDCANNRSRCTPVPKCLVNPCLVGKPMALPETGVTGLCTKSSQCAVTHWCHLVGYNGFGFCCKQPASAVRGGQCPSVQATDRGVCSAQCKVDPDCPSPQKCCFNGCGFSCTNVGGVAVVTSAPSLPVTPSRLGECPARMPKHTDGRICTAECQSDRDCQELQRCCADGCGSQCVFPAKTTACLHAAITARALTGILNAVKCDSSGRFEQVQCQLDVSGTQICWCVNQNDGKEIPGTRSRGGRPSCTFAPGSCPQIDCTLLCPFGYKLNAQGCAQCECLNPCSDTRLCKSSEICIMTAVQCYDPIACVAQPRCVPNACPNGFPFKDVTSGQLFQCGNGVACPSGYWCHEIGFNARGFCCPLPASRVNSGQCPAMAPVLGSTQISCAVTCRSDENCGAQEKCCYNGCGMHCARLGATLVTSQPSTKPGNCPVDIQSNTDLNTNCVAECQQDQDCSSLHKCCIVGCSRVCAPPAIGENVLPGLTTLGPGGSVDNKLGTCPPVPDAFERSVCTTDIAECSTDRHCNGLKKCCSDGCSRRCVYPETNTACRHLQASLEQIETVSFSPQCTSDGEFMEIQCDPQRGMCWCVKNDGSEVPGTRVLSSRGQPNCRAPKICPQLTCGFKDCRYGAELNFDGCPTCNCYNPCKLILCAHPFQVCALDEVKCIRSPCPPVPRCVVSACPQGRPLMDTNTFTLMSCQSNNGCSRSTSFCHPYKPDGGYCCPNPEPSYTPGSCPALPPGAVGVCKIDCNNDQQCSSKSSVNTKCCFNGCGMSCLAPVQAQAPSRDTKLGECASTPNRVCQGSQLDECLKDSDCPNVQKCCSDGCARKCVYAHRTTNCLHRHGASQLLKSRNALLSFDFLVQCQSNGEFEKIQGHNNNFWCTDVEGMEIPGTRVSNSQPDCNRIRSCPHTACNRVCPFGYKLGSDGCEQCACEDPCENIRCPFSYQVCRLVRVNCFTPGCAPVPKCIANGCPTGDPLRDPGTWEMSTCHASKSCPSGHFCRQAGFEISDGYCCPGPLPLAKAAECPSMPTFAQIIDRGLCKQDCKTDSQCSFGSACCYNGCGMTCHTNPSLTIDEDNKSQTKVGVCPVNPLSNPGCRSDCNRDRDCPGFQKCCPYGCGRICQLPHVSTSCLHLHAALQELGEAGVDCETNGDFNGVQCSSKAGQCWCVDIKSGIEKPGTRATGKRPNCDSPSFCTVRCSLQCQHGLQLDTSGCPLNGQCKCLDPCQHITCPTSGHICLMEKVTCITSPCVPVPRCRPNPCGSSQPRVDSATGQMLTCSGLFSNECDSSSQCVLVKGQSSLGLCCPKSSSSLPTNAAKIGECPRKTPLELSTKGCVNECAKDTDCSGASKCCVYGCAHTCTSPANSTNCLNYQAAVDSIIKRQSNPAINPLYRPVCDSHSGMFSSVQCDSRTAMCWCVDTLSGTEVYGTRARQDRPNCSARRSCAVSCSDRSVRCTFGFELDELGCPRDANCKCRNPCNDITCPTGQICLMRDTPCREATCQPVPSCEVNPCSEGISPAVEPRTHQLFTCLRNQARVCPGGYHCAGYDQFDIGVCCLGSDPISSNHGSGSVAITCKHGDPFSLGADGAPLKCSPVQDVCPSTHYCLSKDDNTATAGICCIRASYACSLRADTGPCRASTPRYFYDTDTDTCKEFTYGGCRGNLNNFGSQQECSRFCNGAKYSNPELKANDDVAVDRVEMGFNISGPSFRNQAKSPLESAFLAYVASFGPKRSEVTDLKMNDDNSVQFAIESFRAGDYSRRVSEAVSAGQFVFTYDNAQYVAQPQTWYSKLQKRTRDGSDSAFLGLLISCVILGAVIIIALCVTAVCLYRKNKKEVLVDPYSTNTSSSPTHYINGAMVSGSEISRPILDPVTGDVYNTNSRSLPRKVFSTDDIDSVRENSGYYSQAQYIWQNGRRAHEPRADSKLYY